MYLPKVYDPDAHAYRVRYAIATILRDRVANEGAFNTCFQMEDADEVIHTILRRGLKNKRLRAALLCSHVINLSPWVAPYPGLFEAYFGEETRPTQAKPASRRSKSQLQAPR
jgi:hypothetical protein